VEERSTARASSDSGVVERSRTSERKFDFDHIGPIAFALLDVDLYVPMIDILPKVYQNLISSDL
jgi:hypothetical protein